jgi:L-ribulose-5-phosphate 4-epimerase
MRKSFKKYIWEMNQELPKQHLVILTGGNVSGRDPETGLICIKPSGLPYEKMRINDMVVLDLDGKIVEGNLKPSSDVYSHIYVYKNMPHVGGVVHTHSPYATAFALRGKPIPVYLSAMADEFGQEIPVAPYAQVGDEGIGRSIVEHIGTSKIILLQNHGVFGVGKDAWAAVRAAIVCEEICKTVSIALSMGDAPALPDAAVKRAYERFQNEYGQKK